MKKSVFILSLTALAVCSANSLAETINYYDENGHLIKEVGEDSIVVYERDAKGKVLNTKTYADENALLQNNPTTTRVRNYREDGQYDTFIDYAGNYVAADNPTPITTYQYVYDENGRQIGQIRYNENGDVTRYQTFERNDAGQLTSVTTYKNLEKFEESSPSSVNHYTYNKHGDRASQTIFKASDWTTPSSSEVYTYQYDRYGHIEKQYTNGELTTSRVYDPAYTNKLWLANRKLIYTVEEARQAVDAAGTDTVNFTIRYK